MHAAGALGKEVEEAYVDQVFRSWSRRNLKDALEDVEVEEAEEAETINNLKQKKNSKFKFKRSKSKKKDSEVDDEISLEQGLEEGQQAIDLFFENRFAESRELAQKQ